MNWKNFMFTNPNFGGFNRAMIVKNLIYSSMKWTLLFISWVFSTGDQDCSAYPFKIIRWVTSIFCLLILWLGIFHSPRSNKQRLSLLPIGASLSQYLYDGMWVRMRSNMASPQVLKLSTFDSPYWVSCW